MGIINGLLTGGVLIGKICQAIGGAAANVKSFRDDASGVSVAGEVSAGGVKFFRSDSGGTSQVYAFNPNTQSYAQVVVPNESGKDGVMYTIAPTQKVPFSEADSPLVSPTVDVQTGLTNDPATVMGVTDGGDSLFNLAVEGLKIGEWVNIGSFKLTCSTTQLIVSSVAVVAGMITYFYFRSDKGVSASNMNKIEPEKKQAKSSTDDVQQAFDIDFASLGFDMNNDTLSGNVQFSVNASAQELLRLSKAPSEPMHPAELRFFTLLSEGKL